MSTKLNLGIWVDIAAYDELPEAAGKTVRLGTLELAVFRFRDGTVKVIQNRCPHKNGVLAEGIVSGSYVFCPMHDRKIDLITGLVQLPDTGCVTTYAAEVRDGRVFVQIHGKE
jgi:nitrite reductase (NADH) small subunit